MAKIFKVQGYYIDANGIYGAESLKNSLEEDYDYLVGCHMKVTEKDIGEWDDENPLNYMDCPESEFEKYFKE